MNTLKKQSKENEEECFQMLHLARLQHPDTVIIDATTGDNGKIVFTVYTFEGETLLEKRGHILVEHPATREAILNSEYGSMVCVVTDVGNDLSLKPLPDWVEELAKKNG